MTSAREQSSAARQIEERLSQNQQALSAVQQIGEQMRQAGVRQDSTAQHGHLRLVSSNQDAHAVQKDMQVQGEGRPAMSPCDGRFQANNEAHIRQAGETLQQAGVKQSAAQQFGPPAHTPSAPSRSQERER